MVPNGSMAEVIDKRIRYAATESRTNLHTASTPTGTRTPVPWLRTKYPRPLDDGGLMRRILS